MRATLEGMPPSGTAEYAREWMRRKRATEKERAAAGKPAVERWKPHSGNVGVVEERNKAIMATAMAFGATNKEALLAAGYKEGSRGVIKAGVRETVAAIRERLQQVPGYRLSDSLEFYKRVSEDEGLSMPVRLAARKELDSKLGYNAPTRVEVNERKSLGMAVAYLNGLNERPAELLRAVEVGGAEVPEDEVTATE